MGTESCPTTIQSRFHRIVNYNIRSYPSVLFSPRVFSHAPRRSCDYKSILCALSRLASFDYHSVYSMLSLRYWNQHLINSYVYRSSSPYLTFLLALNRNIWWISSWLHLFLEFHLRPCHYSRLRFCPFSRCGEALISYRPSAESGDEMKKHRPQCGGPVKCYRKEKKKKKKWATRIVFLSLFLRCYSGAETKMGVFDAWSCCWKTFCEKKSKTKAKKEKNGRRCRFVIALMRQGDDEGTYFCPRWNSSGRALPFSTPRDVRT